MDLDIYGNPVGTKYPGEGDCPAGMMCIPENEFHMQLQQAGMEFDETTKGDRRFCMFREQWKFIE